MKIVTGVVCGLFAAALTGCVKEQPLPEGMPRLQVVGVALERTPENEQSQRGIQTRAAEVNHIFTFEDGDALSLFLRGATYADVDNRKVTYGKPGAGAGTWAIDGAPILLNDRTAVVSLVHPFTAGASYDNIPFTAGVYGAGKDLLWKQQDVYATVNEAQVAQMRHALARVKIVLKRDDPSDATIPDRYTGAGAVTSVALSNGTGAVSGSEAIFTDGTLDLSFTAPASPVTGTTAGTLEDPAAFTLSTTEHTTDLLTLPVAAMAGDLVTLTVAIDGTTMTANLPAAAPADQWEAGTCYTYGVTVKSRVLVAGTATVGEWIAGGEQEVEPIPLTPTLAVDENGILVLKKGSSRGRMLFFRFGSVVGFTQEGDWAADKVLFNPVTGSPSYATYTNIPLYASADFDAGRTNVSAAAYHNGANVKAGKGDPCKLVGLSAKRIQSMTAAELDAYNSGWRLPTPEEQFSFTGQTDNGSYGAHWTASDARYDKWYYSSGSAGGYFPKDQEAQQKNYLPAAGCRSSKGSTGDVGRIGHYWSGTAYGITSSYSLYFDSGNMFPSLDDGSVYGFGARCVRTTP